MIVFRSPNNIIIHLDHRQNLKVSLISCIENVCKLIDVVDDFCMHLQNLHPKMRLTEPQVYSLDGRVTDWPSIALAPGKTGSIYVHRMRMKQQNNEDYITGFALVRLENYLGDEIPDQTYQVYLLLAWHLSAESRYIYANVIGFSLPPNDRLKDPEACRRFYYGLLEPHLQPAGQEIAHGRILKPNRPGIFFWASMETTGPAHLNVMLRQLTRLPIHALSAASNLACRRRTTRRLAQQRPLRRQATTATASSVVFIRGEIMPGSDDDTFYDMDSITDGHEDTEQPITVAEQTRQLVNALSDTGNELEQPSVLVLERAHTQQLPGQLLTAQLPVDETHESVHEDAAGNETVAANELAIMPKDWEKKSALAAEA
jgi:hypothetical protein